MVSRLTTNLVAKYAQDFDDNVPEPAEVNALDLVLTRTTIPVPRVRRAVPYVDGGHVIVTDYVKGVPLADVWSTYTTWQKVKVAFTLRRYVLQLRHLETPAGAPVGPLTSRPGWPRTCVSPVFGRVQPQRGPFYSYAELSTFMNEQHTTALNADKVPEDDSARIGTFDDSQPLVLTHQAIHPEHIIVGENERLYLVDFALSGYYPRWFEFVSMQKALEDGKGAWARDEFWRKMIPFVCGPCFEQEKWLARAARGLEVVDEN